MTEHKASHEVGNEARSHESRVGLLSNPKRFNVATSRAMSLCVIVGNPYVLKNQKYWKMLLQYCVRHNSYCGCPCPLPDASSSFGEFLKKKKI